MLKGLKKAIEAIEGLAISDENIGRSSKIAVNKSDVDSLAIQYAKQKRAITVQLWTDGNDLRGNFLAYHPVKTVKGFEADWSKCLDDAKTADPKEWNVTDVFKRMRGLAWEISEKPKRVAVVSY
jgi:hypothetical protein